MIEQINELKKLKPVTSEEEYWYAHKIFISAITSSTKNVKMFFGKPTQFISEFEELLTQATRLEIITLEYANKKRTLLYNELRKPSRFTHQAKEKIQKLKDVFKSKKKKLEQQDKNEIE